MTPFEELIDNLGKKMELELKVDNNQACCLDFGDDLKVQIDLEGNGDKIVIGSVLGKVPPGTYRRRIFEIALIVNGMARNPRGVLSFSEKNDSLILFQFFPLSIPSDMLYHFILLFQNHARVWFEALLKGEIPQVELAPEKGGSYMR